MNVVEYKTSDTVIARVGVLHGATPTQVRNTLSTARRALSRGFPHNTVIALAEFGGLGVNITFARSIP